MAARAFNSPAASTAGGGFSGCPWNRGKSTLEPGKVSPAPCGFGEPGTPLDLRIELLNGSVQAQLGAWKWLSSGLQPLAFCAMTNSTSR